MAGIQITSGFEVNVNTPVDDRLVKATVAERNAIPAFRRYVGLTVYVTTTDEQYRLVGGIADVNWTLTGGGSVSVITDSTLTGNGTSGSPLSLADGAVTTSKIQNGQVTTIKIADDAVSNAKLANVSSGIIKGRVTTGAGDVEDLSASQVRTLLNVEDGATADQTNTEIRDLLQTLILTERLDASAIQNIPPTNLGITQDSTSADITSSTGTGITIQGATTTQAGLLTAADKTILDGLTNVTASNGLTRVGDDIQLGGPMTAAIAISGNQNFNFIGLNSFNVTSVTGGVNLLGLVGATMNFQVNEAHGINVATGVISDFGVNGNGVEYDVDYSPNFTDRSLVDKGYADSTLTGNGTSTILQTPTLSQDGFSITWDNTNSQFTLTNVTGGGGGITNGAANNELPLSDGTNLIGSGLLITSSATQLNLASEDREFRLNVGNNSSATPRNILITTVSTQTLNDSGNVSIFTGSVTGSGNQSGDIVINTGSGTSGGTKGGISIGDNNDPTLTLNGYTWPTTDGTNGQVLTTNGNRVLSFATVSGGGGDTRTDRATVTPTTTLDLSTAITQAWTLTSALTLTTISNLVNNQETLIDKRGNFPLTINTTNFPNARITGFPQSNDQDILIRVVDATNNIFRVAYLDSDLFLGTFTTLANLQTAFPTAPIPGAYAHVDAGSGTNLIVYAYDTDEGWVQVGSGSGTPRDAGNGLTLNGNALDLGDASMTANVTFTPDTTLTRLMTFGSTSNLLLNHQINSRQITMSSNGPTAGQTRALVIGGSGVNIGIANSASDLSIDLGHTNGMVLVDNILNRGLIGGADFSSNIQNLDYTQKVYVDTRITGNSTSSILQSPTVTQNGFSVTWDNANSQFTLSNVSGGGGITNGAANNEIPLSDGTNLVGSGINVTTSGSTTFVNTPNTGLTISAGTSTSATARGILIQSQSTLNSNDSGDVSIRTGNVTGSGNVSGNIIITPGTGTTDANSGDVQITLQSKPSGSFGHLKIFNLPDQSQITGIGQDIVYDQGGFLRITGSEITPAARITTLTSSTNATSMNFASDSGFKEFSLSLGEDTTISFSNATNRSSYKIFLTITGATRTITLPTGSLMPASTSNSSDITWTSGTRQLALNVGSYELAADYNGTNDFWKITDRYET